MSTENDDNNLVFQGEIIISIDGKILFIDQKIIDLIRKHEGSIQNPTLEDIFSLEVAKIIHNILKNKTSDKNFSIPIQMEGVSSQVKLSIKSLFSNIPNQSAYSLQIFEITKNKFGLLENNFNSDKSVDEFTAALLHELRSPVNIINASLQLMTIEHKAGQEVSDLIDGAIRAVTRISNMMDELLLKYRMRKINHDYIDIRMVMKKLAEDLHVVFETKGILVDISIEDDVPVFSSNEEMLYQLLDNLIRNAINAIEKNQVPGKIAIRISYEKDISQETDGVVIIEVTDNGIGISESKLKYLFEPYYSTTKGGTGLGLMYIKNMVDFHRGSISVKSAESVGTTFTVKIPVNKPENWN